MNLRKRIVELESELARTRNALSIAVEELMFAENLERLELMRSRGFRMNVRMEPKIRGKTVD
jgi:hypothetical protein